MQLRYGGPAAKRAFRFFLDEKLLVMWFDPRRGGAWWCEREPVLGLLQPQLSQVLQVDGAVVSWATGLYEENPCLVWVMDDKDIWLAMFGPAGQLIRWDRKGRVKGDWQATTAASPFSPEELFTWAKQLPRKPALVLDTLGTDPEVFASEREKALRGFFLRLARTRVKRSKKLKDKLNREMREAEKDDSGRAWADWILAAGGANLMSRGFHSTSDLKSPEGLPIPPHDPPVLDAALTLKANANKLYRRAQRAVLRLKKAQEKMVQAQQHQTEDALELERIENLSFSALLDLARDKVKSEKKKNQQTAKASTTSAGLAGVKRVDLGSGWQVLVGRSSKANDLLTRRAKPHDFWFHTADYPGSHVLLPNPNKVSQDQLPGHILQAAARLAAENSQAKGLQIGVNWTQKKFLRRPRKAKPGQVLVERFKTILVAMGGPGKS